MNRFLAKLFVFGLVAIFCDRAVHGWLRTLMPSDYRSFLEVKEDAFSASFSPPIVFLGDSHTSFGVNPRVVSEVTGIESINIGVYEASFLDQYYLLKGYLTAQKMLPKIVIIGTNPRMFSSHNDPGKYTLQFIKSSAVRIQYAWIYDEITWMDLIFLCDRDNYLKNGFVNFIQGRKDTSNQNIQSTYDGYLEITGQRDTWLVVKNLTYEPIHDDNIEIINRINRLCREKGVKLLFVDIPVHPLALKEPGYGRVYKDYRSVMNSLVKQEQVYTLWVDPIDFQQTDFYDAVHLNHFGASKFSMSLANKIKQYIQANGPV